MRRGLGGPSRARLIFTDHHESHAASAFFPSPFDQAAILTLDGVGEWSTATFGVGEGNRIRLIDHISFPHSLGLLYSAFTYYCGFKVNSGEYKLMGLAPYGRPIYRDLILERLIDLKPDGSFWLDMDYFNYCQGLTMTNRRFHRLFGGPPRVARVAPGAAAHGPGRQHPGRDRGGRAADRPPRAPADRDEAPGPGRRGRAQLRGQRPAAPRGRLRRPLDPAGGRRCRRRAGCGPVRLASAPGQPPPSRRPRHPAGELPRPELHDRPGRAIAGRARAHPGSGSTTRTSCSTTSPALLADGKVVGWFQGRMEFGPRALGARSILGDPRSPAMQATMNSRSSSARASGRSPRPCSGSGPPSGSTWSPDHESPYMLLVAPVLEHRRVPVDADALRVMEHDPDLRRRVNVVRSEIPAVTHVDYSARIQTVDERRNPRFYRLLEAFDRLTGCPVLVNTSFNVRGEPIVCTPEDAYRCFLATDMDALVLEDIVIVKDAAAREAGLEAREAYLAQFQLD